MAHQARRQVEEGLYALAERDPEFRARLTSDPKGALSQLFGGQLPEGLNVQVHEEDPNTIHIVLPNRTPVQGSDALGKAAVTYCTGCSGSWSTCGYELTCYGPTCNSD
ncbi:MAG TPA: NHLP leader peptide family RiPP precursor [Longimicrobium sp.]|nr:NHLP leader peptide family RiPP precursor [Longimicrobium sp.]